MSHLVALVGLSKKHTFDHVRYLTDSEVDDLLREMEYIKILPDPKESYSSAPSLQLPGLLVMGAGELRSIITSEGRLPECDRDYYMHKLIVAERELGSYLLDTLSIGGTTYGWSESKLWNVCENIGYILAEENR
jgi:hypothetical protein